VFHSLAYIGPIRLRCLVAVTESSSTEEAFALISDTSTAHFDMMMCSTQLPGAWDLLEAVGDDLPVICELPLLPPPHVQKTISDTTIPCESKPVMRGEAIRWVLVYEYQHSILTLPGGQSKVSKPTSSN